MYAVKPTLLFLQRGPRCCNGYGNSVLLELAELLVDSHCRMNVYDIDMFLFCCCSPFPSVTQHPSYADSLEVKREYYQNCSVLDCVTQCSQSAAHLYEQFLQVLQMGLLHKDCYAVCRSGCLQLYYCNMMEWL